MVNRSHCCVSARTIVMGSRQPCPNIPVARSRSSSVSSSHRTWRTSAQYRRISDKIRASIRRRRTSYKSKARGSRRNWGRNLSALLLRASLSRPDDASRRVRYVGHGCNREDDAAFWSGSPLPFHARAHSPLSPLLLSRTLIYITLGKLART